MTTVQLYQGDCLEVMRTLPANSVHSIVCDPPYGLSFMGKNWDHGVPGVPFWEAALRVAKPGAHLLAFGGDRTHHRMMTAIEDAGWEIRTCLYWLFGSGFPKSHQFHKQMNGHGEEWRGWGTALKPAAEIIVLAMKPLDGTFANNALVHGVAGLNVDASRIPTTDDLNGGGYSSGNGKGMWTPERNGGGLQRLPGQYVQPQGRWPANVLLDEEAAALLDEMSGERKSGVAVRHNKGVTPSTFLHHDDRQPKPDMGYGDVGGASRFFYVAKSSRRDRDEGLEGMPLRRGGGMAGTHDQSLLTGSGNERNPFQRNHHPTVKPTQLMRYLVRLVTPPGGTVLDPFMGSGSTGKAAKLEGFAFVGIEIDAEYLEIARRRIEAALPEQRAQLPLLEAL